MTDSPETTKRFNDCLFRFQAHDPRATDDFERLIRPYLINLSRRIAPQLPADLHEEVAQQTCLNLLGNSATKFNPNRATAKMFLVLAVRNALRQVRADYCPPGNITRPTKFTANDEIANSDISIEELRESDYATSSGQEIITRSEVNSLLRLAPSPVAVALERIYYSGDKLIDVAEDLDISRFKLSREIAAYFERMQIIGSFGNVTFSHRLTC